MGLETTVGLIVNASASRDVRRLTSLARTIDVHERVNVVARVLRGLVGGPVGAVLFMPEPAHVVERAVDLLAAAGFPREVLGYRLQAVQLPEGREALDAAGTASAARAMAAAGASCLVTVGGDGTNRAVACGWPSAVVVPLPGGTNNAFGMPIDPTAAALAAALYAADPERFTSQVRQASRLDVRIDGSQARSASALVDVVLVRSGWLGAHALWDPVLLVEAVVTRSDPSLTGLAGVAGMLCPLPVGSGQAVHVTFDPTGAPLIAPLGPGQLVPIGVGAWRLIEAGDRVELGDRSPRSGSGSAGMDGGLTLAFDGEREIVLEPGASATVHLATDGPRVLDAHAVLWAAAKDGELAGRRAG
jgi:hypothetical protein